MKRSLLIAGGSTLSFVIAQPHGHQHEHFHLRHKGRAVSNSQMSDSVWSTSINQRSLGTYGASASLFLTSPSAVTASPSQPSSGTATFTSSTSALLQGLSSVASTSASSLPSSSSTLLSSEPSSPGNLNTSFSDGQLDCATFPSQFGAVALDYLGLGGWSGLQSVTLGANGFSNIVTGISGQTCSEGMMCSYACPAGYQKSQWPATQGATGQSIGGIQCSGGKLHLTNPGLSRSLCIPGMGGVQVTNNAGEMVAICRTDYPGTESETIPVEVDPGETQPLANPNAATYYTWQGSGTSAQYYLNPIGISAEAGCQWGSSDSNIGNWAPINFGVGYSGGKTWLSIFQNKPTTYVSYAGTVSIQGDISASCTYANGQYCGAAGCNSDGCTVAVNSGTATFMVST